MPRVPKHRRLTRSAAIRFALLLIAVVLAVAACSGDGPNADAGPRRDGPQAAVPPEAPAWNPNLARKGPGSSLPLHLGYILPAADPEATVLWPQAPGDVVVQMRALVISARPFHPTDPFEPSLNAALALLQQVGMPYDHIVATDPQWNPQSLTDRLVASDGTGRYQAVFLATNNLVYEAPDGTFPSAFDAAEWAVLQAYERAYGVRQVALYAQPSFPWGSPDDYGVTPPGTGVGLTGYQLGTTSTGRDVFTDVDAASQITVEASYGYPSTLVNPGIAAPLLTGQDGSVMAVQVTNGGREYVGLFFDNAAWGGVPVAYTQQLGAALVRWATRGIHLGEKRNSFQGDIDDWFLDAGHWNASTHQIDDDAFNLTAKDVLSLRDQQQALRSQDGGIASALTWSMAFNGMGTTYDGQGQVPTNCTESTSATLTYITKCVANDFFWVSHTWDHEYMDFIPTFGVNLDQAEVEQRLSDNDQLAVTYGFGANYSRNSVVTGDISGLGWYAPQGPDTGPKVDHGLNYSSPYFIRAAVSTGHDYVASNMSTPSHEPDCWACGTYLTLANNVYGAASGFEVFLVPRYPTNLFATVTTPAEVVDAYNMVYGEHGTDQNHFDHDLTYQEILDVDTDIALGHLLSGSPYPHYFHTPNVFEYQPGKSVLTDWTSVLIGKYAALVNEPLHSLKNDDSAAYVQKRTDFARAGVSGVWNRTTGEITVTSANGGTVFLTGASLGSGATTVTYNGRVISERAFTANQSVTIDVAGTPPSAPQISSFEASALEVVAGTPVELSWAVIGANTDITLSAKGGGDVATGLPASGSRSVEPRSTVTYELVVSWVGGTLTSELAVAVIQPPTVSLVADPTILVAGESSTLSWEVSGAHGNVQLRALGTGGGVVADGLAAAGNLMVSPTQSTSYQLAAAWAGGEALSAAVEVVVTPAPVRPSATFTATPPTIASGDATTLEWQVSGDATSISIRTQGGGVLYPGLIATGTQQVSPTATTTFELVLDWVGGAPVVVPVTVTVEAAPEPPTVTFTSSASSITAGHAVTLSWAVGAGATNVRLETATGTVLVPTAAVTDSFTHHPDVTTTYRLVVEWARTPAVTREVTVAVTPPVAPVAALAAAPASLDLGGSSLLTWSITGDYSRASLHAGAATVGSALDRNGSISVTPNATTTYELRVEWAGETVTSSQQVTVVPTATFSATPTDIVSGGTSTLAWVVAGGHTRVTVLQGGTVLAADQASTGSLPVSPTTTTTTYELRVEYLGGTVSRLATVTVSPAPVAPEVIGFALAPTTVFAGQSAQLAWEVRGSATGIAVFAADTLVQDGLASSGTLTVTPTASTTYELRVGWSGGAPVTRTATLTVEVPVAPSGTLSAEPATILVGGASTLAWQVAGHFTNTTVRTSGGQIVSSGVAATGSAVVAPTTTTTYELVVTPVVGSPATIATTTVTVEPLPVAPAATLTANPGTVTAGQATSLSWAVTGTYTNISLRNSAGTIADGLGATGSRTVTPTATTTYELVVTWPAGAPVTAATLVTVNPAAPAVSFSANPASIVAGDTSTLAWEVTGAHDAVTLQTEAGVILLANADAVGSFPVTPTARTSYHVVVSWGGGPDIVRQATVEVAAAPVEPEVTLSAYPATITEGESTQLSWTVTGSATGVSLRIKGGDVIAAGVNTVGTRQVAPAATTTYEMAATWAGGTVTAETTVVVRPAPDPDPDPDPDPEPGEGETALTLRVTGEAFGLVIGSPNGAVCLDECTVAYPEGTTVTLTPVPLLGSTFQGFGGACTGDACSLVLASEPLVVEARFGFED